MHGCLAVLLLPPEFNPGIEGYRRVVESEQEPKDWLDSFVERKRAKTEAKRKAGDAPKPWKPPQSPQPSKSQQRVKEVAEYTVAAGKLSGLLGSPR